MSRRMLRPWGLFVWLCSAASFAFAATTPDPWIKYFSAQGNHADWADTVRGKDRGSQDSARLAGQGDLIVPVDWGLRSGKDERAVADVLRALRSGKAQPLMNELASRARALEQAHRGGRIYWQLGNEINSRSMGRSLGAATGAGTALGYDDPALVPLYAEFLFAPAAEVLRGVSEALYADPGRIRIVLGSIASIHRAGSREWLHRLLEYRLEGTAAPSLKGRRVAELVSVVSVHYAATADDPPWQQIFDGIAAELPGAGSAHAIWATEELGKRRAASGLGAATAVRVAAAYLARAAERQQGAEQLRCSFYGWTRGAAGTTGNDGMQMLLAHFGRERVEYLGALQELDGSEGLESRVFRANSGRHGRLVVIHGAGDDGGSLASITLPAPFPAAGAAPRMEATLFTPSGLKAVSFVPRPDASTGRIRYTPARPLPIGRGETLLLRESP